MRLSSLFLTFSTLFATGVVAIFVAVWAADTIEDRSLEATEAELARDGHDWVLVDVDGLLVRLTGTAQSEAMRFSALTAAGRAVEPSRLIDSMTVEEPTPTAPDFAVEIMRNGNVVSIIGLVPAGLDAPHILNLLGSDGAEVVDLLESADFAMPSGLTVAADFGARAALRLERSKVSVTAERVSVQAAVDSPEEKARLQSELARLASDSFVLGLDLKAPRPVITPFTLRFTRSTDEGNFDVCSADTEEARDAIRKAAVQAGLKGKAECTLGLGAPSPSWSLAVTTAIEALAQIGEGSVTFSDADVTLIADKTTEQAKFDQIIGELQTALPASFSLHAVLPPNPTDDGQTAESPTPEFLATLSPEGHVQLRGRVANDLMRDTVEGFARARFGSEHVYVATRPDPNLPAGWPVRILAALDALSRLENGSVVVQPAYISLRGRTGDTGRKSQIAGLLTEKLGAVGNYQLDVRYDEALDPMAGLPTPQECVARIQAVQQNAKISFEPGKATIDEDGLKIIDRLVDAWTNCEEIPIEVAGHTDSQGRESMNLTLSQTRAESVIDALLARRVLTSSLVARGYGETTPIADNDTEEGREANRRIEFHQIEEADLIAARRAELASDTEGEEDEQN